VRGLRAKSACREFFETNPQPSRNKYATGRRYPRRQSDPGIGEKMKGEILPPLASSAQAKPPGWSFRVRQPWLLLPLIPIFLVLLVVVLPLLIAASLIFRFSLGRSLRRVNGIFVATHGFQPGEPGVVIDPPHDEQRLQ
jgi:hypothetical protein